MDIGQAFVTHRDVDDRDLMSPAITQALMKNEALPTNSKIHVITVPKGTIVEVAHIVPDEKNPRHNKGVVYLTILGSDANSQEGAFGDIYSGWAIAASPNTLKNSFTSAS